jgi:hypothetical protein
MSKCCGRHSFSSSCLCQVSQRPKRDREPAVKCVCKSVPFEVTGTGAPNIKTIFENPQGIPNSGVYTVLNFTNSDMPVDFIATGGPFSEIIPPGGSVTKQLNNLTLIRVTGNPVAGEDGRLDFEICFPIDFPDVPV